MKKTDDIMFPPEFTEEDFGTDSVTLYLEYKEYIKRFAIINTTISHDPIFGNRPWDDPIMRVTEIHKYRFDQYALRQIGIIIHDDSILEQDVDQMDAFAQNVCETICSKGKHSVEEMFRDLMGLYVITRQRISANDR